jgi:riboflavin kinase/FMN adenylyltransferase
LYGTHVAVDFATRLRAMVRFDSADDLVAQMHRDVGAARAATEQAEGRSAAAPAPEGLA